MIKRISNQVRNLMMCTAALLGVSITALGAPGGGQSDAPEAPELADETEEVAESSYSLEGLKQSLQGGRFWMNFRYRFENVSQTGIEKDARASTLRTRLGYESATYHHWTGLVEFSDVSNVPGGYTDYNDTINGKTDRPIIADPSGAVVNRLYAKYDNLWGSTVKVGRQRIQFDNNRFIGSAPWRQTEQVFDAVSIHQPDLAGLDVVYAYIDHINRVLGPRSPVGDLDSNSHFVHVSKQLGGVGELTGYGYYVDLPAAASLSSFTYGLRFNGDHAFDKWTMLYTAELAHQDDVADNPNDVDAGYLHAVLGGRVNELTVKAGYEVLGGGETALNALQTPLAARHGPNGWADVFLVTPAGGLEDLYVSAGYELQNTELLAAYHDFSPETGGGGGYGSEFDLQAVHHLECGVDVGLKYASYSTDRALVAGSPSTADVQKFWLWMYYSF